MAAEQHIEIPPYCERCYRNLRARYEPHTCFTVVFCEHCGDVLRIADRDRVDFSEALDERLTQMGYSEQRDAHGRWA